MEGTGCRCTTDVTDLVRWKHETFLYPAVRVFAERAAGSGTIIYSEEDPKCPGEHLTFVLTNHHVVDSLIKLQKGWDSLLKRNKEIEVIEKAKVEVFSYVRMSQVDSSNRYNAEVVAYDKHHDLAVLRIDSPSRFQYVAKLIPRDKIKDLKLFTDIVVTGCSLAHEPFSGYGQITFLNEIIEQKQYLMSSASSVFGNSGGALFLADSGEMIGVPSRVTTIQLGFGVDVLTWMSFAAHPSRIYEFFDEHELQFLYDKSDNFHDAMARRKRKEKEALLSLKAEVIKEVQEGEGSSLMT